MPYVHVDTDVWLSPEECGTAISKQDLDTVERFVKVARAAVDALFDAGEVDKARELMKAGAPIPALFGLSVKWPSLRLDEAYQAWLSNRQQVAEVAAP